MWLLLNSAGRCSAACDQTGASRRPKAVRRSPLYACWSASIVAACHHTITSASARSAETS